jgi:hypothetical protein
MCIFINNMHKGRKIKPFHMAEKLLCGRAFLVKVTGFGIITAIHDNREYENY